MQLWQHNTHSIVAAAVPFLCGRFVHFAILFLIFTFFTCRTRYTANMGSMLMLSIFCSVIRLADYPQLTSAGDKSHKCTCYLRLGGSVPVHFTANH